MTQLSIIACSLLVAALSAANPPDRPHVVGALVYEGELRMTPPPLDEVEVKKRLSKDGVVLGRVTAVIADRLEPSVESADYVLREIGQRVGGDVVIVKKSSDVTSRFREASDSDMGGVDSLEEFEIAAIVARAQLGGGELWVDQQRLFVTAADRFGDSDVSGTVTLTLSRTHDPRDWTIGKVGPRYRCVKKGPHLLVVTGPSDKVYDVRIVKRRAKVYLHGRKQMLSRVKLKTSRRPVKKQALLYYTEFLLIIGSTQTDTAHQP